MKTVEASKNRINLRNKKWVLALLAGFLSTIAISVTGKYVERDTFLETLRAEIKGIGLSSFIIMIALCLFYHCVWQKAEEVKHWTIHILSLLFSGFMIIGLSFSANNDWSFFISTRQQEMVALLTFAGYVLLFEAVLRIIYYFFDHIDFEESKVNGEDSRKTRKIREIAEKHFFLCSLIVILVCWLPWLIIFFPGSLTYDGCNQLFQAFGLRNLTDQHSWVLTLLMGFLMKIGQKVSDNCGIFLIVCTLSFFEAVCYASACRIMYKWKIPFKLKVGMVLFFGLFPVFGAFAQAVEKDGPFMAAFVIYMVVYINVCLLCREKTEEEFSRAGLMRNMAALLISGYLVCILRNNGAYLVLPADLLLIALLCKNSRRYAVGLLVGACAVFWVHGNVLAPAAGVTSATTRATLSIPFQITGRYLSEYPDDLTESEKETLSKVFRNYTELGEVYNSGLSDPIKKYYRDAATTEDLAEYFTVILSMFQKHPGVCIQAVLNQSYGYYYPFYNVGITSTYQLYIQNSIFEDVDGFEVAYVMPSSIRAAMTSYANMWKVLPVFSQMVNPGTPTWVLFLLGGYLAYRKRWQGILLLAAPSINMVICAMSPVNGLLRYAMSSLVCLPMIVIWCILITKDRDDGVIVWVEDEVLDESDGEI